MTECCNLTFLSLYCKDNKHQNCHGRWYGLGYEFYCECPCHEVKKGATDMVCGPDSVGTNSLEETKEFDK